MPKGKKVPKPIREGRDLLDHFYGFSRKNDPDRYLQKHAFCQDVYRVIVIQMHLAIEELVRSFLLEKLTADPDPDIFNYEQNVDFVLRLSDFQVLALAARLHVLSKLGFDELTRLNAIRNKCAHHWSLHSFSVAERIKSASRDVIPEIEFNGKNLLTPKVMKDKFLPLYGAIYLELWAVNQGLDCERIYTDEGLEAVGEVRLP